MNTASRHPGNNPCVGTQGSPTALPTRTLRRAPYALSAGRTSQDGRPALSSTMGGVPKSTWS
eukprot:14440867-Alexandrium_andersonii.AAC.1